MPYGKIALATLLLPLYLGAQAKAGWDLVWSDEFAAATIDAKKWTLSNGASNVNSELEYYSNSAKNAFLDSGALVLRAIKENVGGRNYTSAKLTTRMKGDWLYGRIEVRARLNRGKGMWPAIWMMPTDDAYGSWPSSGEMDIMELLGHEPAKVYGTVHWNSGGHQQQGSSKTLAGGTFADDYHVFGYEWSDGKQAWFIDDVAYFNTAKGKPFDKRFYLILNVAVGGGWPGNPDGTTVFPNDMAVDWVRVYVKGNGSVLDAPPLSPGMRLPALAFADRTIFVAGVAPATISLFEVSGHCLLRRRLAAGASLEIGPDLRPGIYVFQAEASGSTRSLRIAKTR